MFVAIALYLRRRPDFHKRMMLLACSAFFSLPSDAFPTCGTQLDFGVVALTEIPALTCILYDTIKHRRLHPAFGWGGAAVLASFPAFMLIGGTDSWLRFITSWVRL